MQPSLLSVSSKTLGQAQSGDINLRFFSLFFVATSFLMLADQNLEIKVDKGELLEACIEFCEVLHHEFIFTPPCQPLGLTLSNKIDFMTKHGVFIAHNTVTFSSSA